MNDHLGTVVRATDGTRSLRFERTLPHPPERVWEALTDPEEIRRWFTAVRLQPREGGEVHLDFGAEGEANGEILVWDPPRVLEHTWIEGRRSVVRWELEPAGTGTRLVLTHSGLDRDGVADYGAGWQVFIDRLPVHLDGGDPGRVPDRYAELRERYRSLV